MGWSITYIDPICYEPSVATVEHIPKMPTPQLTTEPIKPILPYLPYLPHALPYPIKINPRSAALKDTYRCVLYFRYSRYIM